MLPKTIVSFGRPEPWVGDAPSPDALSTAFHSSLQGSVAGSAALYRAAARHFLFWIEQQGVAVSAVDDAVVRRFEKHRCHCRSFSRHEPNRPAFTSKVRRFVRFMALSMCPMTLTIWTGIWRTTRCSSWRSSTAR